jgi:hypothetical protein
MNRTGFRGHFQAGEHASAGTVPEKRLGMTADCQIACAGAKGNSPIDQTPDPTWVLVSDIAAGSRAEYDVPGHGGTGRVSQGLLDPCPHAQGCDESAKPVARHRAVLERSRSPNRLSSVPQGGQPVRRSTAGRAFALNGRWARAEPSLDRASPCCRRACAASCG